MISRWRLLLLIPLVASCTSHASAESSGSPRTVQVVLSNLSTPVVHVHIGDRLIAHVTWNGHFVAAPRVTAGQSVLAETGHSRTAKAAWASFTATATGNAVLFSSTTNIPAHLMLPALFAKVVVTR